MSITVHKTPSFYHYDTGRSFTTDGLGVLHIFSVEQPFGVDRIVTAEAAATEVASFAPGKWERVERSQ